MKYFVVKSIHRFGSFQLSCWELNMSEDYKSQEIIIWAFQNGLNAK